MTSPKEATHPVQSYHLLAPESQSMDPPEVVVVDVVVDLREWGIEAEEVVAVVEVVGVAEGVAGDVAVVPAGKVAAAAVVVEDILVDFALEQQGAEVRDREERYMLSS